MVWGGRDPTLRIKPTLPAMARLVETGHLEEPARQQLEAAYRFLRQVEHRLQMVNDRQTHTLPDQPAEMDRIACFMGYPTRPPSPLPSCTTSISSAPTTARCSNTCPNCPAPNSIGPDLDFRGDDPEPAATVAALRGLGYHDTKRIVASSAAG